jgi:TolB protein
VALFHSESSDIPIWSSDSQGIYFTAQVDHSIELMYATISGTVNRLTRSAANTRHYHPAISPDGQWILFGSDRSGSMQLFVARRDGSSAYAVTNVPAGHCAMHGHWQPRSSLPRD